MPDQDPPGETLRCWLENVTASDYPPADNLAQYDGVCDLCGAEAEVRIIEAASGPGGTVIVCQRGCRQFRR